MRPIIFRKKETNVRNAKYISGHRQVDRRFFKCKHFYQDFL